jgi:hypothetical protein
VAHLEGVAAPLVVAIAAAWSAMQAFFPRASTALAGAFVAAGLIAAAGGSPPASRRREARTGRGSSGSARPGSSRALRRALRRGPDLGFCAVYRARRGGGEVRNRRQ